MKRFEALLDALERSACGHVEEQVTARASLVKYMRDRESAQKLQRDFCDCPNCPAYGSFVRALADGTVGEDGR